MRHELFRTEQGGSPWDTPRYQKNSIILSAWVAAAAAGGSRVPELVGDEMRGCLEDIETDPDAHTLLLAAVGRGVAATYDPGLDIQPHSLEVDVHPEGVDITYVSYGDHRITLETRRSGRAAGLPSWRLLIEGPPNSYRVREALKAAGLDSHHDRKWWEGYHTTIRLAAPAERVRKVRESNTSARFSTSMGDVVLRLYDEQGRALVAGIRLQEATDATLEGPPPAIREVIEKYDLDYWMDEDGEDPLAD